MLKLHDMTWYHLYIYICMYLVLIAVGVMESDARCNVYTNSVCMYSKFMLFWSMISINVMWLDKVSINHMNFSRHSFLYSSKHWILTCNPHPCSMYMFSNVNPGLVNPLPPPPPYTRRSRRFSIDFEVTNPPQIKRHLGLRTTGQMFPTQQENSCDWPISKWGSLIGWDLLHTPVN